jgi:uncharacterized glyoxalase superfamily protein PhnB
MDQIDHLFIAPLNYEASLSFYRDTLGFSVATQWGGNGVPRGSVLKSGSVTIVIAEPHDTSDSSWRSGVNGTRPTLHITTDDVKHRFQSLKDRSRVVIEPEKTHWGIEWFVVADPEGNLIAFEKNTTTR